MRGGISSNCFVRGYVGIRGHIIRLLGQSSTFYLLGRGRRRDVARQILSSWREGDGDETYRRWGDRDPPETQQTWVHTLNETEYAHWGGACGLRTTIETVNVICGNNPEGFTFHAPSRQSGNLQQHKVRSGFFPSSTRISAQYAN
jgi:hypothetical protein